MFLCSLSKSVQAAHYMKDRGLDDGSICEVRTARRDMRNVGRTVGLLTLTLPTAGLTKLHSHTLLSTATWVEWTCLGVDEERRHWDWWYKTELGPSLQRNNWDAFPIRGMYHSVRPQRDQNNFEGGLSEDMSHLLTLIYTYTDSITVGVVLLS